MERGTKQIFTYSLTVNNIFSAWRREQTVTWKSAVVPSWHFKGHMVPLLSILCAMCTIRTYSLWSWSCLSVRLFVRVCQLDNCLKGFNKIYYEHMTLESPQTGAHFNSLEPAITTWRTHNMWRSDSSVGSGTVCSNRTKWGAVLETRPVIVSTTDMHMWWMSQQSYKVNKLQNLCSFTISDSNSGKCIYWITVHSCFVYKNASNNKNSNKR
jgi:hypothetical protein